MYTFPGRWTPAVQALIACAIVSCTAITGKDSAQSNNPPAEEQGAVLARMGGVTLTGTYFQSLLTDMSPTDKKQVVQDPRLAEKLLRDQILKYYLLDLSRQTGWSLRPEVMRKARYAADQVIVASFLNSKATVNQAYPDQALIEKTYATNRDKLRQANQVRLAQIFITGQGKAQQDRINMIHRQLAEQPDRFEALARTYSQHKPSAANSGDLGWQAQNLLLPGLPEVVARMQPGEISSPIPTGQGFHIIRLAERKPGEILTLEQSKPFIVNQLRIEAAGRSEQQYLQNILKKNPITVDSDALGRILRSD